MAAKTNASATTRRTVHPSARGVFIDVLLDHWPQIEDSSVPPVRGDRRGAPCQCCETAVDTYDPKTRAMVGVLRDEGEVAWRQTLDGIQRRCHLHSKVVAVDHRPRRRFPRRPNTVARRG